MAEARDVAAWAFTTMAEARRAVGHAALSDDDAARLASIVNAVSEEMERAAKRPLGSRTYTGAGRMKVVGDGTNSGIVKAWPITTLTSVKWIDSTGAETALDLTAAWCEVNEITLPNGTFSRNTLHLVEATAGYLKGFSQEHDRALALFEELCLEVVILRFKKWKTKGAVVTVPTKDGGSRIVPKAYSLPDEVMERLAPFARKAVA